MGEINSINKNRSTSAKAKFSKALEILLKRKQLDTIQVSEIASAACLSRKTFYRHFADKYDLSSWYFSQFFESSFGRITRGENWETSFLQYLTICQQKADILKNAYVSRDINGLRNYDIDITKRTYEKYLVEKGADTSTKEMKFAIDIASRGGTDMVIQWLLDGQKEDKAVLMTLIKRTLPQDILFYLD